MIGKIERACCIFEIYSSLDASYSSINYSLGYLQGLRFGTMPRSAEESLISLLINLSLKTVLLEGGNTYAEEAKIAGNKFAD